LVLQVAEFIGTQHHEFVFTIQEGIDALSDVIYQIETYDVTSIRASTPMYLMSRKIKAMGVKMVLSGVCGQCPFPIPPPCFSLVGAAPGRIALSGCDAIEGLAIRPALS
jgi:hypothetical protein